MFALLIRGVIVYVLLIIGVRLMGKRQIGELQPTELVITLLISDIATMPLQNVHASLLQTVVVIVLLIALELLFSILSLKFRPLRTLIQGNSVLIIKDGTLQQKEIRDLRYSIDDLVESMRLKDVFDLSEIAYAYVETNGELSILKNQKGQSNEIQCLVICDGKIIDKEFSVCGLNEDKLRSILKQKNLSVKDVFLMTYASEDSMQIIKKED